MNPPKMGVHIGDLLRDTGHLRAMLFGSYLLLLFHHWSTGSLPDDDEQLSSIARLTQTEWKKARPILIKFFEEGWRHSRVEEDLAAAKESYDRRAKAGEKGGKAKASAWQSSSNATAPPEQPLTFNQDTSVSSLRSETKTTHFESPVVVVVPPEPSAAAGTTTTTKVESDLALQGQPAAKPVSPLGTALPEDWIPDEACMQVAHDHGMDGAEVDSEVLRFHAVNAQRGAFSQNWNSTWTLWCAEFKRRKAKEAAKAPPRVEVSKADPNYVPSERDWEFAAKHYAQSGRWNLSLGPDPTSPTCKCPPDILAKYIVNHPEQIPVLAARVKASA